MSKALSGKIGANNIKKVLGLYKKITGNGLYYRATLLNNAGARFQTEFYY